MARSVLGSVPREAAILLDELQATPRFVRGGWWARRERRKRVLWHLQRLDVLGVPAACPMLLALVADRDRAVREGAARAFVGCARGRPAAVALVLEALDSPLGGYRDAADSVDDAGSYGWVAHCLSRNGYAREAALGRLERLAHPWALAFVLVRLNDWVPQVRRAALAAARAVLAPRFARAWVLAWPVVDHLERCGRVDRRGVDELVADARRMLAAAWNGGAVEEGMRSEDALVRRAAWRLALEFAPAETSRELLLDALAADDVVVARRAADLAGRLADPGARAELLARRLECHDPHVRRRALERHPVDDPATLERALEPRLLDRHRGVRAAAADLWRARLGRDPVAFYRERLGASDPLVDEARARPVRSRP